MIDLAHEKTWCEALRRGAPEHTHRSDEEILLSCKSVLDLKMGVSFPDAKQIAMIALRAGVFNTMEEQRVLLTMLMKRLQTRGCTTCAGDGKSREFKLLHCDDCQGTGIRLLPS